MKLHLPKTLLAAVLACFTAGASYGVRVDSILDVATIVEEISASTNGSTTKTWNGTTYTFTSSDGMLKVSGYALSSNSLSNITFQANKSGLQALDDGTIVSLLLIDFAGTETANTQHKWGVNVKGTEADSSSLFTGQADGNDDWTGTNASRTKVSNMADDGIVSAYFNKNDAPGVSLANGYESKTAQGECIYYADGLRWSSSAGNLSLKFNTTYVTSLIQRPVNYQRGEGIYRAKNADGTWQKDYTSMATAVSDTQVGATLVAEGRLEISSSDQATSLNTNGGDIIIGGSGQLYLNPSADIELSNAIYLGGSTYGDADTQGALYFGGSGTTTLSGAITLIENSTMGADAQAHINSNVTGDYKLSIVKGTGIDFTGGMNLGTLELASGVSIDISGTEATVGTFANAGGDTQTTVTVTGTTLTISGLYAGSSNVLNTGEDGAIVFGPNAAIDVSNLTATGSSDYTVNGFIQESYRVTASGVTASISGGTIDLVRGEVSLGSATWSDGMVTMGGAIYNVVTTKSYDDYLSDAGAAGKTATSIVVQEGGTFEVTNTNQTIAIAGTGTLRKTGGGELTVSDLSKFTGTLEIVNDNSLTLNTGAKLSTLTMGNNTTLTVSGEGHKLTIGTQAADLNTMGDGVTISSSGETRTLNAEAGATLRDNRYLLLDGGTLNIGGGGTVEVFGISLSCSHGNATIVNIADDTTMHIFGTSHETSAGNKAAFSLAHWSAENRLNVYGTLISDAAIVSITGAQASLNVKNGGKLVMTQGLLGYRRDDNTKSTINIENGGTLSVGSAGTNTSDELTVNMAAGSTIEAYNGEGGNNTDGNSIVGQTLTLGTGEGVVNFSAASGKTLTIKSLTGDRGINIKGAGTVALDGVTFAGATSVEAGSTLSLKGNVTISKAIDSAGAVSLAEGGTLTLTGVNGLEASGDVSYKDAVSGSTQNGYANASYIVVKGSGTVTNLDRVQLYNAGYDLTTDSSGNRVITLGGTRGDYYVREGEVVYGGANNAASSDTTGIVLNGGSLKMQQDLADGVNISLSANGTVSLASNVTLSSDRTIRNGHKLTLGGDGKYIHKSADGDFSLSNYGFADNWNGTVELEAKASQMNLSADGTSAPYKGTMILNFDNYIIVGLDTSTNSIFGENTQLELNAGANNQAMILNRQYTGKDHALTLASLSSGANGTAVSHIRGDWGGSDQDGHRYLKVNQNIDTKFAGIFYQVSDHKGRDIGLIKNGTGNLTLTGANTSGADLDVNRGTLTFKDNGAWAGNINIEASGTLAFDGGEKTWSQNGTIANGAHIKTLNGVTLTLTKAIGDGSAPVFNIAEGTTLKVEGNGDLGGSKFEGTGTLLFEKADDIRSTGNTFTGTLDIASGLFSIGKIGTGESYGRGDADFNASKVLVHDGATFQTNNGEKVTPNNTLSNITTSINATSTLYAESGSTLKNMDGDSKWSGTIHLNVSGVTNLSGTSDPEYNAGGETTMHIHWGRYVVWDALVKGAGTLNIEGGNYDTGDATHRLVLNNNGNTFQGTYRLVGKTSDVQGEGMLLMELKLNQANAAQYAIINIDASDVASAGKTNLLVGVDATIAGLEGTENGTVKADGGAHTLTINQSSDRAFAGAIANGDTEADVLGITKEGTGTLTLSGANTYTGATTVAGGTLEVTGTGSIGSTSEVAVSGDGTLKVSGERASVTAGGITARANGSASGTAKKVTIDSSGISRVTSGEGDALKALGELSSMTLTFAAENTAAEISDVTMRDVTLDATGTNNGTVTYTNVEAEAATVSAEASPALYADTSSDTPPTLTAMAVQSGGTASGTLTIDVTSELLRENFGSTLNWTFLNQVTLGSDFTVELGNILAGIVSDGLPKVYLTVDGGKRIQLTSGPTGNINNITTVINNVTNVGGLLAGTTGAVNVMLTIENIPEPTTGTLSVLALAALAARRRRRE